MTTRRRDGWARRLLRYAGWGLFLVVLVLAAQPRESGPTPGAPAADFTLPRVGEAGTFRLADASGKPLLIEVFASWCSACRRANQALGRIRGMSELVPTVAVSVDADPNAAKRAQENWPVRAPVLHDEAGEFSRLYGIEVLPTFILLDHAGRVAEVHVGEPSQEDFERWISQR